MGLRLLFLPNFPAAMFIQGATFLPDFRVCDCKACFAAARFFRSHFGRFSGRLAFFYVWDPIPRLVPPAL